MMLPIYKYLIEWLDEHTIKTYELETENFTVLRLHGGEFYKLNGTTDSNYWQQWKNETGHTTDELTDICVVWREGFDIKNFFDAGKSARVQSVSPTTWTSGDLEKFFAYTDRQLKSKLRSSFNSTIRITTSDGKKFLVATLEKPYPLLDEKKSQAPKKPQKTETPEQPNKERALASYQDISNAWQVMASRHQTR